MKLIEVVANAGHLDTLVGLAEQYGAIDCWFNQTAEEQRCSVRMLVDDEQRQAVLDALQNLLGSTDNECIVILPVEASLPRPAVAEEHGNGRKTGVAATREELYNQIDRGARLDSNYLLMVLLSTLVAAIGLLQNNVAVVVGAMVIAPLLGPNIALAFATSLGDRELFWRALKTNIAGVAVALLIAVSIGLVWPIETVNAEILSRTQVGYASVVLALASGAAAVLSLTNNITSALVGVMVAVALLPPTATLGMLLAASQASLAFGAGMLLVVNVVCVNLAANLVFLLKGVRPRTWLEQHQARQSRLLAASFWLLALLLVLAVLYVQNYVI